MGPFVEATWLLDHRREVVVCDVHWSPTGGPRPADRVTGAVEVDLDRDLAAPASREGGRHPLPSPTAFAVTLERLGIGATDPVVAYDHAGGGIAARLVWMLRVLGQRAALLDGGLVAWRSVGGAVADGPGGPGGGATGPGERPVVAVPVRPWPAARLADADVVADAPTVLDARDAARHRGDDAGPDARAGRIPGSRHAPWTANVDDAGRLLDRATLRARYAALVGGDPAPVASCGSGVTACHDLLVLEHLGVPGGRLFPGSWSAWAADVDRPIEVG